MFIMTQDPREAALQVALGKGRDAEAERWIRVSGRKGIEVAADRKEGDTESMSLAQGELTLVLIPITSPNVTDFCHRRMAPFQTLPLSLSLVLYTP